MRLAPLALGLLCLSSLALAATPTGAAIDCRSPANPFPPSPVGGEVGAAYGFATGTAHGGLVFGVRATCAVAGQAIGTVNGQCQFLIGKDCVTVA